MGLPAVGTEVKTSEENVLACLALPEEPWSKLPATDALERLNREFGTHRRLVGTFPSESSLLRFATALLMEIGDDWQVDTRYMAERSMTATRAERPPLLAPAARLIG